jgi:hypothetical protein
MKVNFYLRGEVVPVAYDYEMDLDGVLVPSNTPIVRNRGTILIVLERGERVPTRGQLKTIATIRTINPNWELVWFFQKP